MFRFLWTILLAICAVSCGPRFLDYFPYDNDGTAKPHVALLPILDCSHTHLPWDIGHAFTCGMRYEIMNSGRLFLLSDQEMQEPLSHFEDGITFISNEAELAQHFCETDFIVLAELMEHGYAPVMSPTASASSCFPCDSLLMMKMRIKIIDVRRTRCPRIVLQEIISDCSSVPSVCADVDIASQAPDSHWMGSMRRAHQHMMRKVTQRIEEAIGGSY